MSIGGFLIKKIKNNRHKLRKGFTLTEVLLLLAIVGVILSGILPVFLNVITTNKSTTLYSRAYKDLDAKMEELRGGTFDAITSSPSYPINNLVKGSYGTIAVTSGIEGNANLKQVTVTINWNFKGPKKISATTFITRGGLR